MSDAPERIDPPEVIYLQPYEEDPVTGRMWCEDDDPAGVGEPWTKYYHADIVHALAAERDALAKQVDELERVNNSVAVCARHTHEITARDPSCWVCEAFKAGEVVATLRAQLERFRAAGMSALAIARARERGDDL